MALDRKINRKEVLNPDIKKHLDKFQEVITLLITFWLKHRGKMQGNNYQIGKEPLLSLLLINPLDEKIMKQIKTFADNLLHQKQTHGCFTDTSSLETQRDQLIYKLYNLTSEEIEIVEKNVS